jgi:hypothetical protein
MGAWKYSFECENLRYPNEIFSDYSSNALLPFIAWCLGNSPADDHLIPAQITT